MAVTSEMHSNSILANNRITPIEDTKIVDASKAANVSPSKTSIANNTFLKILFVSTLAFIGIVVILVIIFFLPCNMKKARREESKKQNPC